jgi:small subunit ribosomal protein S21e
MQNDAGEFVDMYLPRKWFVLIFFPIYLILRNLSSSSSRIISAKDHASVQLDFCEVDPETGRAIPGKSMRYTICGQLRFMVNHLYDYKPKSPNL